MSDKAMFVLRRERRRRHLVRAGLVAVLVLNESGAVVGGLHLTPQEWRALQDAVRAGEAVFALEKQGG